MSLLNLVILFKSEPSPTDGKYIGLHQLSGTKPQPVVGSGCFLKTQIGLVFQEGWIKNQSYYVI